MIYYEIYIENYWICNFWMDFLLLLMVRAVLRCPATQRKMLAGAVIGATLSCISLTILSLPLLLWEVLTYGITGILMLVFTFSIKNISLLTRAVILFFSGTVFFGGILSALTVQVPNWNRYGGTCLSILGAGTFFCCFILRFVEKEREKRKNTIYHVTLRLEETVLNADGLWDTGNHLLEPLSGKSVSIADVSLIQPILNNMPEGRLRMVPYKSIGCKNGIIQAYRIDEMSLTDTLGRKQIIMNPCKGSFCEEKSKGTFYH